MRKGVLAFPEEPPRRLSPSLLDVANGFRTLAAGTFHGAGNGYPAAPAQKAGRPVKMNPGMDARKPLRARKTMAPSSRKQVDALNEMKNNCGAENTPNDAKNHHGQLQTVEAHSVVQRCQEASKDPSCNTCTTDSEVKQLLNSESLQEVFYKWYRQESNCPLIKPVEVHLDSASLPQLLDYSDKQLSGAASSSALSVLRLATETEGEHASQTMPVLEAESATFQLQKEKVLPHSTKASDDTKRKRGNSESSNGASSKYIRTSQEGSSSISDKTQSGLAKIKCFIQKQLDASTEELEHRIQSLNERISHTQCLHKHGEIAMRIMNRISQLEINVNRLTESQKTEKFRKAGLHPQSRMLNAAPSRPRDASGKVAPPSKPPSNQCETLSKPDERSDDVLCLGEVSRKSDTRALNPAVQKISVHQWEEQTSWRPPDIQQKDGSANSDTLDKTPCDPKLQNVVLIDLTDEQSLFPKAGQETERRVPAQGASAPESQAPGPSQSASQLFHQVFEDFSHLPPLPKIRLEPEPMDGYRGTLPPVKLRLCLGHVKNPSGIGLQWNVCQAEPRCAQIESFHLFMCLEQGKNSVPTDWMKIDRIKALDLPMACVLSEVPDSAKCYFTMQSRDIYGRYGPFSDIQSIRASLHGRKRDNFLSFCQNKVPY
nr:activating transcription factor 7-interacting protein 2 [Pogona vitticeps]